MVESSEAAATMEASPLATLAVASQHGVQRGYEIDPYAVADTIIGRIAASWGASRLPLPRARRAAGQPGPSLVT